MHGIDTKIYWSQTKNKEQKHGLWENDTEEKRMAHLMMSVTSHWHKTLAKVV
jgi:hypothetical protein